VAWGREHYGIVFYVAEDRTLGDRVRFLILLHAVSVSEQMRNKVEYA